MKSIISYTIHEIIFWEWYNMINLFELSDYRFNKPSFFNNILLKRDMSVITAHLQGSPGIYAGEGKVSGALGPQGRAVKTRTRWFFTLLNKMHFLLRQLSNSSSNNTWGSLQTPVSLKRE